ncbi:hypothetical protein ITP53_00640 [Nonomuraea sp. K274]|uniref:Uncharacterized protein n=1 Tax=Nonomuraea cypriaca TaxID=1187855 RepID=A0A931A7L3_9ACTN|nr:hypothetical protein [Nonomuraea cypriaca]MBF8184277.1 hypothetical protein [Nonomuraea cypriaca]
MTRFDLVEDVGHEGVDVIDQVTDFFRSVLKETPAVTAGGHAADPAL